MKKIKLILLLIHSPLFIFSMDFRKKTHGINTSLEKENKQLKKELHNKTEMAEALKKMNTILKEHNKSLNESLRANRTKDRNCWGSCRLSVTTFSTLISANLAIKPSIVNDYIITPLQEQYFDYF